MPIRIHEKNNLFSISGDATEYIIGITEDRLVSHLFWGAKTECLSDFTVPAVPELSSNDPAMTLLPEEYAPAGGLRYKEPCLKCIFGDGNRDLVLLYKDEQVDGDELKIYLEDQAYDFQVTLGYRVYAELDIIERWVECRNQGPQDILLTSIASAAFNFDGIGFHHTNVFGHWGAELKRFREPLTYGKKVLEGRRGNTGHNHNPFFILDKGATEDYGGVYFGVLAHSGNFKVTYEVQPYHTTQVVIGINDYDFSWRLSPGESFVAPSVYAGFTPMGLGDMSQRLDRLATEVLLPEAHRLEIKPVLYNSWEATYFDVTCEGQKTLAGKAAELGVELFVVDDGWFGKRNSDQAGLGDWNVNSVKFPQGLSPLIDHVKQLGMSFGIWIEPEMVNPDSDLYRSHPDWVYQFKKRQNSLLRNQLVLNLCHPDVVAYLTGTLDRLLRDHDIRFIKWDYNRPISEAGASNLDVRDQPSIWLRHTLGVYQIVDTLRKKHPRVVFEACASGGGRVDYGCLRHFDQFWPSDNTDALDRLSIQDAYSLIYPVKAMRAWVTDCPNFLTGKTIPLSFRFHAAMTGTLGIGGNLMHWSEEECEAAKGYIAEYKKIAPMVQQGRLFRLSSVKDGLHAVQYVLDGAKSVVFAFHRGGQFGRYAYTLKLKGLLPNCDYVIDQPGTSMEKSGEYLMKKGLGIFLWGDYASTMIHIVRADSPDSIKP